MPFRSYVNLMIVLIMWLTHYNHQFMTLIFCSWYNIIFGAQTRWREF